MSKAKPGKAKRLQPRMALLYHGVRVSPYVRMQPAVDGHYPPVNFKALAPSPSVDGARICFGGGISFRYPLPYRSVYRGDFLSVSFTGGIFEQAE